MITRISIIRTLTIWHLLTTSVIGQTNLAPVFTQVMNNLALSEGTPVGSIVYKLEGFDPEGSEVFFGLVGTDKFHVDPHSGDVTIIKSLDREEQDTLSFLVSIKDRIYPDRDSEHDNLVEVPITVIVLDENDNSPTFENIPYEAEVLESAPLGVTVFDKIFITDKDTVGENLEISCLPESSNPDACSKFILEVLESSQNSLRASVILNSSLDYNDRMIYYLRAEATDGLHSSKTQIEIRVKDIQNNPPIFQGSLAAVVNEDSPIGALVLKVQARDGDRGEPRKIVYDLISNPMEYFLLDAKTGELRTAKPLDREALPDATGLVPLIIRAREVIDGVPGNDETTSASTQASVTIKDVNDSPPTFDKKEYFVSILENTAIGTPLALEMNVTDKDVGTNAIFSLRLEDVSGVFSVEPKIVRGSSQVSIRVANGTLDYENPNQRKFIILVIAEELETNPRLSSTATVTIAVVDANDNRPIFGQESYSATISEAALPGQYISSIVAKDQDSANFGDLGIVYSLSGTDANLFHVDHKTGVITLADCHAENGVMIQRRVRSAQATNTETLFENGSHKVNVTANGETGVISVSMSPETTYSILPSTGNEEYIDYEVHEHRNEVTPIAKINNHLNDTFTCLDYEKQSVYFLSYKATDDEGKGQTSVVSLKISVLDSNDSPPICESPLYRASVDEGARSFDPPLVVKARDADTISDVIYSLVGVEAVISLFDIDKRSGQITIKSNALLDVNRLNTDKIYFTVEANDGVFSTFCAINITVRDVNNHAPQFERKTYFVTLEENSEIGTRVEQLKAHDLDTGINALLKYRIQQGSFDDFQINETEGIVTVSKRLDYDRRNTYQIEVLASDMGTPSLSGTATLTVQLKNSNDKDPYFVPATQRAEVREDAPIGTIIHSLVALDPDISSAEALEFAATEPITAVDKDGNEIINIDRIREVIKVERSGQVVVNQRLDRDQYAVIRISVLVTDSTAPTIQQGKGLLIISIVDVNEVAPMFAGPWTIENPFIKLQTLEERPIGSVVTTLQAHDEDSSVGEFAVSENDFFDINRTTGVITGKSRLDFEKVREVRFTATVTDTGVPQLTSTAQVIVDVVNVNDNDPYFLEEEYNFNVLENSPRGTVAGKVQAKDNDAGIFGEITYSLVGEQSKNFYIEPDTGIIMVANSSFLDREIISTIYLNVIASDKAPETTQRSTTVAVKIKVLDINDNSPIFVQRTYSSSVAENAALSPPAALLQVVATDKDDGVFGDIKYFTTQGNEENLFLLDPTSGILYPAQSLLGKTGKYVLTVEARDLSGAGPNKDVATITVDVLSVNQHRPVFVMPALSNATIELTGDIRTGYLVMTVKATDNDTGENGKISYHFQVNNKNVQNTEAFEINENTGELRTKKDLQRKVKSSYQLVLVARDQGSPSWFETLRFLSIILVDVNENRPEFPDASNPYKISVPENSVKDIRVGKIQAFMKSKNAKTIYYYMLLGNEDGAFSIEKTSGDLFINKSLDRETTDLYNLYILASTKSDLHISDTERAALSIKSLERDSTVAKVWITVLDENDNEPIFEKSVYYAGISAKAGIDEFVVLVNASDKDYGTNATIEFLIAASNLYKFGSSKSTGSIVPSPFAISKEGRIVAAAFMAEYNQDRFELDIIAKEVAPPYRLAASKVNIWIFDSDQLIRVILSRPPGEVHQERDEIVAELRNATQKRIVVDEIRYHVDAAGRIRMDWCDLFFHAIDLKTQEITPVEDILKVIDANYDYLKDYYAGFAIENVVPAYTTLVEEEFDLALAGLVALIIVLFVGAISFTVLCCCLKNWNLTIPEGVRRNDALIKKQFIEDLNTTENPLWIEQKLKLYEEQELTMQVFSEPELGITTAEPSPALLNRRNSYETSHTGDNTYATILPRSAAQINASSEVGDDYATLRNTRVPSLYEFTGSTFQAPVRDTDDFNRDVL